MLLYNFREKNYSRNQTTDKAVADRNEESSLQVHSE